MRTLATNKFFVSAFILVSVLLVYSGLFRAAFINWDDGLYITENHDVAAFNVSNFFSRFYVGHYQPVTMLAYGLLYKIAGDNPFYFHAFNVLVHAANGILLFYLARSFLSSAQAVFIALLFCFHPMQVENVGWASELKTLLSVHFYLWAFVFYYKYLRQQLKRHYVLTFLFFILACLSKPIAVTFPVLMLLTDYIQYRKLGKTALLRSAPFFVVAAAVGWLSYYATKTGGFMPDHHTSSLGDKMVYAGNALGSYLFYFVAPYRLSVIYPYPDMNAWTVVVGLLSIVLYGAALWLAFKKNKPAFFALLLFLLHIGIYLQFVSFGEVLLADRYMYLAIPALAYLLVVLGNKLITHRTVLVPAAAALLIAFGSLTWKRTQVWTGNEVFWTDILEKFPESEVALSSMGAIHLQNKKYTDAAGLLDRAIAANVNYAPAHYNKGLLLVATNDLTGATAAFTIAIALNPSPKYYLARARAYYLGKYLQEAKDDVEYVLKADPGDLNAIGLKAMIYDDMGQPDIALNYYNQVLDRDPGRMELVLRRGVLYGKLRRFSDAVSDFTKVIGQLPQSGEAYYWRAVARFSMKQNPCPDLEQAVRYQYAPAGAALSKYCNQ